eukprot:6913287-Alexandrium_andersonii.AAC.1
MSASLVGSEMCIRDRGTASQQAGATCSLVTAGFGSGHHVSAAQGVPSGSEHVELAWVLIRLMSPPCGPARGRSITV